MFTTVLLFLLVVPVSPVPACNNDGIRDEGEECDDRNGQDGDGCSSECIIEETLGKCACDHPYTYDYGPLSWRNVPLRVSLTSLVLPNRNVLVQLEHALFQGVIIAVSVGRSIPENATLPDALDPDTVLARNASANPWQKNGIGCFETNPNKLPPTSWGYELNGCTVIRTFQFDPFQQELPLGFQRRHHELDNTEFYLTSTLHVEVLRGEYQDEWPTANFLSWGSRYTIEVLVPLDVTVDPTPVHFVPLLQTDTKLSEHCVIYSSARFVEGSSMEFDTSESMILMNVTPLSPGSRVHDYEVISRDELARVAPHLLQPNEHGEMFVDPRADVVVTSTTGGARFDNQVEVLIPVRDIRNHSEKSFIIHKQEVMGSCPYFELGTRLEPQPMYGVDVAGGNGSVADTATLTKNDYLFVAIRKMAQTNLRFKHVTVILVSAADNSNIPVVNNSLPVIPDSWDYQNCPAEEYVEYNLDFCFRFKLLLPAGEYRLRQIITYEVIEPPGLREQQNRLTQLRSLKFGPEEIVEEEVVLEVPIVVSEVAEAPAETDSVDQVDSVDTDGTPAPETDSTTPETDDTTSPGTEIDTPALPTDDIEAPTTIDSDDQTPSSSDATNTTTPTSGGTSGNGTPPPDSTGDTVTIDDDDDDNALATTPTTRPRDVNNNVPAGPPVSGNITIYEKEEVPLVTVIIAIGAPCVVLVVVVCVLLVIYCKRGKPVAAPKTDKGEGKVKFCPFQESPYPVQLQDVQLEEKERSGKGPSSSGVVMDFDSPECTRNLNPGPPTPPCTPAEGALYAHAELYASAPPDEENQSDNKLLNTGANTPSHTLEHEALCTGQRQNVYYATEALNSSIVTSQLLIQDEGSSEALLLGGAVDQDTRIASLPPTVVSTRSPNQASGSVLKWVHRVKDTLFSSGHRSADSTEIKANLNKPPDLYARLQGISETATGNTKSEATPDTHSCLLATQPLDIHNGSALQSAALDNDTSGTSYGKSPPPATNPDINVQESDMQQPEFPGESQDEPHPARTCSPPPEDEPEL